MVCEFFRRYINFLLRYNWTSHIHLTIDLDSPSGFVIFGKAVHAALVVRFAEMQITLKFTESRSEHFDIPALLKHISSSSRSKPFAGTDLCHERSIPTNRSELDFVFPSCGFVRFGCGTSQNYGTPQNVLNFHNTSKNQIAPIYRFRPIRST
ncbi:hypothetical protein RvY_06316-3 [Ramazzottius varieornatus]|uniref:Uncharacterized protein n=1 Tax=Ramazzottius varieornatus TaxID=947166 RepID=A0A1D1V4I9_RAMVA|nr:hypothetical protein RvY_06316-3 [Ramazzottius varieornatus]